MDKKTFNQLEKIAARNSFNRITTLETRDSDALDFHEVSVWGLRKMLEEAYLLGKS